MQLIFNNLSEKQAHTFATWFAKTGEELLAQELHKDKLPTLITESDREGNFVHAEKNKIEVYLAQEN